MHRGGSRSTPSFPIVSYLLPQRAWEEDHPRTLCPALRCQFAPLQQLPEVQPPVQVPPALLNGALLLPLTGCCCEMVERPSLLLGVVDFLGRGDAALSWRRPSTHRDNAVREGKFEGDKHTARLSNLQRGTMKPLKDLFSRKKSEPKVNSPLGAAASASKSQRDAVSELYEKYREKDGGDGAPDQIGPEGIMEMCSDMGLEPTDVKLLILAWCFQAEEQGYFSKAEWIRGMSELRVDSMATLVSKLDSLDRQLRGATSSPTFKDFYKFAFRFSRSAGQKSLEIESVKALLITVLPPPHPHVESLLKFLEATPSIRGLNEDQWSSFLLFSHDISIDFSNFDPDGAWPSMLDDYVCYCKENRL